MDLESRALYNSLRINWLNDADFSAQPWQVEDYRTLSSKILFDRLELQDIALDKVSFTVFAESFETPEEMTQNLLLDTHNDPITQDQVYLLIFELWRRFQPEKPCLSILCDELDYQIFLYDAGQLDHLESLQDILANLILILDENADQGINPLEIFKTISASCAHDLENFLYDFIDEQIDEQHYSYALELVEGFQQYSSDAKWFNFLRSKLLISTEKEELDKVIHELLEEVNSAHDLEFNLEILNFLIDRGKEKDFLLLVRKSLPLIHYEEDFQDLLTISTDFYHLLDKETIELALQKIIKKRAHYPLDKAIHLNDTGLQEFRHLLSLATP